MEKDRRDNGVQRVRSRDTAEKAISQRQENEVIGAVVVRTEKGWRDDSVIHMRYGEGDSETGLPQWQRIAGNTAVVKGGRRDNGVQRVCSRDTVEKAIPQWQRNVEFAAIVDGVRV